VLLALWAFWRVAAGQDWRQGAAARAEVGWPIERLCEGGQGLGRRMRGYVPTGHG
jgi:hypothetical protein